jgi:hypothetical protein
LYILIIYYILILIIFNKNKSNEFANGVFGVQ